MAHPHRRGRRSRWLAWIGPVAAAVGVLVALELLLWATGQGETLDHDPFAGFSSLVPMFEAAERPDGTRILRTADPPRFNAPQEFLADKPEGGFRIFVVGGSSAAGVPYSFELSFSGWLQKRFDAELPGVPVEVVNAARSAYASRRLLAVTRELAGYEPDLLIIYSGHNEWGEARFYRHLIGVNPMLFRLRVWLASTRLYAVVAGALGVGEGPEAAPVQFDDVDNAMQMFAVANRRLDGEVVSEREMIYREEHYRHNLEQMILAMREAGAQVMLVTLAQNLGDWPPGASSHRTDLPPAEQAAWEEHVARGRELAPDDCAGALGDWTRALALDDQFAQLHFDVANCHRTLGRLEGARRHYLQASDLDRIPHGAPSRYNEVVRELAAQHATLLVDVAEILTRESPGGIVGADGFVDFAHPRLRTQQRIARAIAEELRDRGVPAARHRWQPARYVEPDPRQILETDPQLRLREHLARAVACLLGRRRNCVIAEAEAALALDPDEQAARDMLAVGRKLPVEAPAASLRGEE
jgi:hypothetical protein